MKPTCERCGHIHPADCVAKLGRFHRLSLDAYAAIYTHDLISGREYGPARATHDRAETDWCNYQIRKNARRTWENR